MGEGTGYGGHKGGQEGGRRRRQEGTGYGGQKGGQEGGRGPRQRAGWRQGERERRQGSGGEEGRQEGRHLLIPRVFAFFPVSASDPGVRCCVRRARLVWGTSKLCTNVLIAQTGAALYAGLVHA